MESAKRKRAAKACNYCRKRKRKCDGRQPVCTLCEEANNSECEYRDEGNESNSSTRSKSHLNTFSSIDSLPSLNTLRTVSHRPGTQTSLSQFANNNVFNTTMDIPLSHSSTTGNLLRSAPAKALLGHYPSDLFLHIELRRPIPEGLRLNAEPVSQIDLPTLSPNETDHLVRNYFQLVHRFHPILDQRAFYDLYDRTVDHGARPDLPSSLVLVVLALGSVAAETPNRMDASWSPGVKFFTPAVRLLLTESLCSFGGDPLLPQALYLAALYYSYLSRPLLAWRLVHMASTDVQHYWIRSCCEMVRKTSQFCESSGPFSCSNEHHLPRSGIEKIVDKLPYPWSDGPSEPYMHRWLADLSSRRLLNRIHYVLYAEAEPGLFYIKFAPSRQVHNPIPRHLRMRDNVWYTVVGISMQLNSQSMHRLHLWRISYTENY
uniref:Zn(2)-C6 fungal-type domain-containing protein n=1 Tax=Fusarium oxysporum (strain Fo5176) TaxID=660025 RepID=A0A0D2YGB8_FUSOF